MSIWGWIINLSPQKTRRAKVSSDGIWQKILLKNNVVEDYDLGVAAEQIITHRKNLIRALQFLDSPHLLNNEIDIIRGLQAALAQCTDQMAQMKGMFDDDDSAIERALEEAEEMQQKASRFLGEVVS